MAIKVYRGYRRGEMTTWGIQFGRDRFFGFVKIAGKRHWLVRREH